MTFDERVHAIAKVGFTKRQARCDASPFDRLRANGGVEGITTNGVFQQPASAFGPLLQPVHAAGHRPYRW